MSGLKLNLFVKTDLTNAETVFHCRQTEWLTTTESGNANLSYDTIFGCPIVRFQFQFAPCHGHFAILNK